MIQNLNEELFSFIKKSPTGSMLFMSWQTT